MFNRIKISMKSMTAERWFNRHFNNPEDFYSSVEELFGQFGPPYGAADNKIIPNGFFWSSLAINVLLKSREYSASPTQKECSSKDEEFIQYSFMHTETHFIHVGYNSVFVVDYRSQEKSRERTLS